MTEVSLMTSWGWIKIFMLIPSINSFPGLQNEIECQVLTTLSFILAM